MKVLGGYTVRLGEEVEKLQLQVRDICLTMLGAEHPDTLSAMGNLSVTYRDQGWWKETEELNVHVRGVCLRVFGADHPDTVFAMGNL